MAPYAGALFCGAPLAGATLVRSDTLECGIQLARLTAPGPEFGVMIAVRTPAVDDSGATHVLEHMVLSGSRTAPDRRMLYHFPERYALSHFNAVTNPALTTYHFTTRRPELAAAATAELLACVLDPVLDEVDFSREAHRPARLPGGRRGIVLQEVAGMRRLRGRNQRLALRRRLLAGTPWRFDDEGAPAALGRLRHADVLHSFDRCHVAGPAPFAVILATPAESGALGDQIADAIAATTVQCPPRARASGPAPAVEATHATEQPGGRLAVFPSLAPSGDAATDAAASPLALEVALHAALSDTGFAKRVVVDAQAPGRPLAIELGAPRPGGGSALTLDALVDALGRASASPRLADRIAATARRTAARAALGDPRHPSRISLMSSLAHGLLGDGRPLEPAVPAVDEVRAVLEQATAAVEPIVWCVPAPMHARSCAQSRPPPSRTARAQPTAARAESKTTAAAGAMQASGRPAPTGDQTSGDPEAPGDDSGSESTARVSYGHCELPGVVRATLAYDVLAMPPPVRAVLAAAPELAGADAEVIAVTTPQGLRAVLLVRDAISVRYDADEASGASGGGGETDGEWGHRAAAIAGRLQSWSQPARTAALADRLDHLAEQRGDSVVERGHVAVVLAAAASFSASAAAMNRWRYAGSTRRLARLSSLARKGRNPLVGQGRWLREMRPLGVLLANVGDAAPSGSSACPRSVAVPILRRPGAGPRLLQGVARRVPVQSDVGFRAIATPLLDAAPVPPHALARASRQLSRRLREDGTAYAAGISVLAEHGVVAAYSYRDANAGSSVALRGALSSLSSDLLAQAADDVPPDERLPANRPPGATTYAALERAWLYAGLTPGPRLREPAPVPSGMFEAWLSPDTA